MKDRSFIGRLVFCVCALSLLTAGAWAAPAIKAGGVQNVFANEYGAAEIARGAWFAVKGSGLGPASIVISGAPYPVELSGTRVTFTPASGGAAVNCLMYYTMATQVAGLLPSSTAAGDYDVRVTYSGSTSAPLRVKVVERNFGFATASSSGAGQAQVTNASLNGGVSLVRLMNGSVSFNGRQWQFRPAYPSETLIAWGTGLGADPASDTNGGASGDMTGAAQVKVLVGGVEIIPAYAGRSSGSPGLDQINFTLPSNVPMGCAVTLQVRAGSRSSNLGTLAIAANGANICTSPNLTADQIQTMASGGSAVMGSFTMTKTVTSMNMGPLGTFTTTSENVGGSFSKFTADSINDASGFSISQIGSCYFMRRQGSLSDVQQGVSVSALDAGAPLLFNGPNASNKAVTRSADNSYNLALYSSGVGGFGGSGSPTLAGGNYILSGNGGAGIGAFTATSPFPAAFTWANKDSISSITRGQPLGINWTGGGSESGALVSIAGMSGSQVGGTTSDPIYDIGMFVCTAPANAGTFTVPGEATAALTAASGDLTSGSIGMLIVAASNGDNSGRFTANVVSGGTAPSQFHYYWAYVNTVGVN